MPVKERLAKARTHAPSGAIGHAEGSGALGDTLTDGLADALAVSDLAASEVNKDFLGSVTDATSAEDSAIVEGSAGLVGGVSGMMGGVKDLLGGPDAEDPKHVRRAKTASGVLGTMGAAAGTISAASGLAGTDAGDSTSTGAGAASDILDIATGGIGTALSLADPKASKAAKAEAAFKGTVAATKAGASAASGIADLAGNSGASDTAGLVGKGAGAAGGGILDVVNIGRKGKAMVEGIKERDALKATESGVGAAGHIAGAVEKGAKLAGTIASSGTASAVAGVAGQVGGGIGAVTGAIDVGKGAHGIHKGRKNKRDLRGRLAKSDATGAMASFLGDKDAAAGARTESQAYEHLIEMQTRRQKDGAFNVVTGALDVAAGVTTAAGVSAAAGLGLAAASGSAKVGKLAVDKGVQYGRDKKDSKHKDLLAREAVSKWTGGERGGFTNKKAAKLDDMRRTKAERSAAIRGQDLGFKDRMHLMAGVNEDASQVRQAERQDVTADVILQKCGDEQQELLDVLGIGPKSWAKMQADAKEQDDPTQALRKALKGKMVIL